MRWKKLLLGGAFIGVFSLGAMFAPIGEPAAIQNSQSIVKDVPVVQLADVSEGTEAAVSDVICPMTGEVMNSGVGMGHRSGMSNRSGMGNRAGMGQYFAGAMPEAIAEELDITVDELRAARYDGKSVAQLAEENGVKVDELVANVIQGRKAVLEQLVKDGMMTQEQMDAMVANMEAMMPTAFERENMGPMNGRGSGNMGMGQRSRGIGACATQRY